MSKRLEVGGVWGRVPNNGGKKCRRGTKMLNVFSNGGLSWMVTLELNCPVHMVSKETTCGVPNLWHTCGSLKWAHFVRPPPIKRAALFFTWKALNTKFTEHLIYLLHWGPVKQPPQALEQCGQCGDGNAYLEKMFTFILSPVLERWRGCPCDGIKLQFVYSTLLSIHYTLDSGKVGRLCCPIL